MEEGWSLEYYDDIAVLNMNRPKHMNALSIRLLEEMDSLLTEVDNSENVRALIISGSGEKSFISGSDIKEISDMNEKESKYLIEIGHKNLFRIEELRIPVIASVNGYALGGGLELILSCDIRLCSKNAQFGFPEIKLGWIPGWGGPYRLTKLIGEGRAKNLIFKGKFISSEEALDYGLVTEVFEDVKELKEGSFSLAKEIADKAPLPIFYDKKIIKNGINPLRDGLFFSHCLKTKEARERIDAFIKKKKN
jgi:enoyl-CoA hydratase